LWVGPCVLVPRRGNLVPLAIWSWMGVALEYQTAGGLRPGHPLGRQWPPPPSWVGPCVLVPRRGNLVPLAMWSWMGVALEYQTAGGLRPGHPLGRQRPPLPPLWVGPCVLVSRRGELVPLVMWSWMGVALDFQTADGLRPGHPLRMREPAFPAWAGPCVLVPHRVAWAVAVSIRKTPVRLCSPPRGSAGWRRPPVWTSGWSRRTAGERVRRRVPFLSEGLCPRADAGLDLVSIPVLTRSRLFPSVSQPCSGRGFGYGGGAAPACEHSWRDRRGGGAFGRHQKSTRE
jgi:hypothetical protein